MGRLHDQDAVLHPPRIRNPDAMLTLPEFMRESLPMEVIQADPQAVLTLPEFMREPMPPAMGPTLIAPSAETASKRLLRSRSMSAPSLAWIFGQSPSPKSPSPGPSEKKSHHRRKRPGTSSGSISVSSGRSCSPITWIFQLTRHKQRVWTFTTSLSITRICNTSWYSSTSQAR